jgi:2-polyprenyl-3-methyl-5-hydroxy-6-metoxy-1,4-benzoquinol methylase
MMINNGKYGDIDFENINCLICGEDNTKLLSTHHDVLNVVRCERCNFTYQNPRPSEKSIKNLYTDDKYFNNPEVGYNNYVKTYFEHQELFERIFTERLMLINKHKTEGKVLEIGCAHGFHLDFMRRSGFDVHGVELAESPYNYARDVLHLDVFHGTVEESKFEDESFDLILMLDLIEHLPDIYRTLDRIKKLLKPDGVILVQVPWELFHWEKVLQAFFEGKKVGSIEPDALPVHLYFFTPKTLISVMRKNGFLILERCSGNYGRIRSKIAPKMSVAKDPFRENLQKIYFKSGLKKLLRSIAPTMKLGSGISLFCMKVIEV